MKNKLLIILSMVFLLGAFIGGSMYFKTNETERKKSMASKKGYNSILIKPHSTIVGDIKNKVIIVEFMDPECPACAVFHPKLKEILKKYSKDVSIVYRYVDIHKNSKLVITMLEAAKKQGKYTQLLDLFLANQIMWTNYKDKNHEKVWGFLKFYAKKLNLDIDKLKVDMQSVNINDILTLDKKDVKTLGLRAVPSLFINGVQFEIGDKIDKNFSSTVEEEIAK